MRTMKFSIKWLVLWSLWAARLVRQPTPPLRVSSGELRGSVAPDGTHAQYMGIPYATVQNRFQAAGPPPTWDETFDAVNERTQCTQLRFMKNVSSGVDDCLVLNVFTPLEKPSSTYLPVMVFIHGGGFSEGSSSKMVYGPDYLMDKGVILVTLNYRLNIEGFLSLGVREAPGNAGMKDQVAALRWVQKNIRTFGGDPDNVTIFGESAGGASVSYHIISPMSKGLFHKAIIQSGSSLASWSFQPDPIDAAFSMAKVVGYLGSKVPEELYKFYSSKSSHELLKKRAPRFKGDIFISQLIFTPCIEKVFDGVEPFLTESPYKILSEGRYNKVPLIIGTCSDEGILFTALESDENLQTLEIKKTLPKNLLFPSEKERNQIADNVRKMYIGNDEIKIETTAKLSKYIGEPFFNYHAAEETSLIVKSNDNPVYHYTFSYDGWRNIFKMMANSHMKKIKGATHADELMYLFSLLPTMFESRMIQVMTTLWTNFAKYGDPTPVVTELIPVKWPSVTVEDQRSLVINLPLSIEPIWHDRLLFWKEAYAKYRRKI